jgi:integrase
MSITASDIEDYIAKRREDGVVNATINRELACIKRMFTLAVKWGEAKKNPAKDVDLLEEPPARNRFLSEEEAQTLIDCCYDYFKPIVITALNTGMRLNEILSLTWDRVHIDAVIDPYLEILQTKNNRARYIHLNEDMVNMLDAQRGKHPEFVFIGSHGQPLKSIRKPFLTALKKAGILNFRFHDLRHTFASHFVMRGGDLLTLKEILGHRSMQMVEKYAHLAAAHKRRQINNLNGMFSDCHPIATSQVETKKAL